MSLGGVESEVKSRSQGCRFPGAALWGWKAKCLDDPRRRVEHQG